MDQLSEIDSLLSDFNRSLTDYVDSLSFDPGRLQEIEDRLNVIRRCQDKYGASVSDVMDALQKRLDRIEFCRPMTSAEKNCPPEIAGARQELEDTCAQLTAARQKAAAEVAAGMKEALLGLNFLRVEFTIQVEADRDHPGRNARIAFPCMFPPIQENLCGPLTVAGNVTLQDHAPSRPYLRARTVSTALVLTRSTPVSAARPPWKVSGKMGQLAQNHQVLCITHLPQIAAIQDSHYLIEK